MTDIITIETAILGIIFNEPEKFDVINNTIDENYFSDEINKIIYKTINKIRDKKLPIDRVIIFDELKDIIPENKLILFREGSFKENNFDDYIYLLIQKKINKDLLELADNIRNKIKDEIDTDDIVSETISKSNELFKYNKSKAIFSFKEVVDTCIEEIDKNIKNTDNTFRTGYRQFDYISSLSPDTTILFAGDKGTAKTNFIINIIYNILNNHNDIKVLWFSMEDPKEKIIRRFVSMKTSLSDRAILSKNNNLTEKESINIVKSFEEINNKNYDIVFCDTKQSITGIKKLSRKYHILSLQENKKLIIIIDNLGLIDCPGYKDEVAKENYVAGEIVSIKEETKALIFVLHHLNKGQLSKDNLSYGYRPREDQVRGSNRIMDYCNQIFLVNYPNKYPDLKQLYENRAKYFDDNVQFPLDINRDFEFLWALNKHKDNKTKNIVDIKQATKNILINTLIESPKDYKNEELTLDNIYNYYKRYLLYINTKNEGQQEKYKKEKLNLYSWLETRQYQYSWEFDKDSRDYYLFGKFMNLPDKELYELIKQLFIIEAIKIRDFNEDIEKVIRYKCNLNSNLFNEI